LNDEPTLSPTWSDFKNCNFSEALGWDENKITQMNNKVLTDEINHHKTPIMNNDYLNVCTPVKNN
jgi:hypothetical protein